MMAKMAKAMVEMIHARMQMALRRFNCGAGGNCVPLLSSLLDAAALLSWDAATGVLFGIKLIIFMRAAILLKTRGGCKVAR
ncbi:hypothetical protein BC829DRAFT_393623 [Chytridium lagenaria]|nr:hypothetical protein BC829DRAFT_393623 [Chytridium lagenaria]